MSETPNAKELTRMSMAEEALAALYLIAGLLAWQIGWKTFAVILFVKASFDTLCALKQALAAALAELRQKKPGRGAVSR